MSPLISVVLPVYNGERFLREAVASILAQSFRDFELILIDDGSTDGSLAIMRAFAAEDDRVLIVSRENRGLVASLNEGIEQARGEWVARMDADDVAHPERLQRQLAWARQHDADVVGSWARYIGERNGILRSPVGEAAIRAALVFDSALVHPSVFARRVVLQQQRYDETYASAEDYELWCRLVQAGYRLANVPEVLLDYRLHGAQITQTKLHSLYATASRVRARYVQSLSLRAAPVSLDALVATLNPGQVLGLVELQALQRFLSENFAGSPGLEGMATGWLDAARRTQPWSPGVLACWFRLARRGCFDRHLLPQVLRLLVKSLLGPLRPPRRALGPDGR